MSALQEAKSDNFEDLVLKTKEPVVVDFWATWCGPCKALTPKLEEISSELGGRARIVKVNVEDCPEIVQQFAVRGVPSLLFFKDGKVHASLSGNQSKSEILKTLQPLL